VSPPPHLWTETNTVSEKCSLVSRIPGDGQSPKNLVIPTCNNFWENLSKFAGGTQLAGLAVMGSHYFSRQNFQVDTPRNIMGKMCEKSVKMYEMC
jgi:hypothetical protein